MRRSFAILVWILLGALAATIGIGSVLVNAKHERERLETQLQEERSKVVRLQAEHNQAITEANRTIADAVRNASATRDLLNAVNQEQGQLDQATPLITPIAARRWPQTIAFSLGLSLRTPTFTITTTTDHLLQSSVLSLDRQPISWLSVTRYDQQRATDLVRTLSNTQRVSYRLNQTLITGTRGRSLEGGVVLVLQTQRHGLASHLIWANVTGPMTEDRILDSLSTLLFAVSP